MHYKRLIAALDRLSDTKFVTNIKAGNYRELERFSLIQGWRIIVNEKDNSMSQIEITLSEWLYNSVIEKKILTYDQEYFQITSAIERRLYEIFRKYLGKKQSWCIGERKLFHKVGSTGDIRKFRYFLKNMNGEITGFRFKYLPTKALVTVFPKNR